MKERMQNSAFCVNIKGKEEGIGSIKRLEKETVIKNLLDTILFSY